MSKSERHLRGLRSATAGLILFLGWQAAALRSYIRNETRPPSWDQAVHLEIAADYGRLLRAGRWSEAWNLPPKPGMPPFPPLYHLGIAGTQVLLHAGNDPTAAAAAALWLNWAYLAVLCAALLGITRQFRNDASALAAPLLFACAPGIQALYHTQLVDLAVVAWVAAGYWAFLRSERFSRWPGSLALGLLYAVGMLHKWSFFSYFLPVYGSGLFALADLRRRPKALACVAAASILFLPWYLSRLPVLIPRLFQATSDFAVPFWKGGAFFFYFLDSIEHLGPALWLLGWIGIFLPRIPRHKEKDGVLANWALTSYVFWAIVPNRQIRFLLPGLPALGSLALEAWPSWAVWGAAAFQIFLSANFTAGWVRPVTIPAPGVSVSCFTSSPPAREEWKIADILKIAAGMNGGLPANATLVSNAELFNGPNFTWTAKILGLPLRLRGVNRRLCELSEFVVLKDALLGPPGVTEGLPEAAAVIRKKGGWFERAFEEAGRWPLPDGSSAILFRQRRPPHPPLRKTAYRWAKYSTEALRAEDLRIELQGWNPLAGEYRLLRISAAEVELRGLKILKPRLELENVRFVPVGDADPPEDVRLLRLQELRLASGSIDAGNLRSFLESRARGLSIQDLEMNDGLAIRAVVKGIPVAARVRIELEHAPERLRATATNLQLGPFPLLGVILGPFRAVDVSFEPNPETPFRIKIPGLTLRNGRLTIP